MWVCHDHFCLIPLQCPSYGYQSSKCGSFTCMFLRWCSSIFAGCFEFVTGNTFGMTALTSYGAFWLSYSAILVDSFGIAAAYEASEETASQLPNAIGFFLLAWGIFTFMLWLNTLKSTVTFSSLFFLLFVTFLLLAGGEFSGKVGVTRAGGVLVLSQPLLLGGMP